MGILCHAFTSAPSLGGIWGRSVEDVGKSSSSRPLALDLVGAWQAEPVWKSPGAMRKSPAAESPQGAAGRMEPPVRWSLPAART